MANTNVKKVMAYLNQNFATAHFAKDVCKGTDLEPLADDLVNECMDETYHLLNFLVVSEEIPISECKGLLDYFTGRYLEIIS